MRLTVAFAALGVPSMLVAQVYLVTGSLSNKSTENFGSELLRVNNSAVAEVEEIVPKETGLWWAETSNDSRILALKTVRGEAVIVDFKLGAVAKRCQLQGREGYFGFLQWLATMPNGTPSIIEAFASTAPGARKEQDLFLGMTTDPAVPCSSSFATVAPDDARKVVVSGGAGIADVAINEGGPTGYVDSSGNVGVAIAGLSRPLGFQIPESFRGLQGRPAFSVLINDSTMVVAVFVGKTEGKFHPLLLLRKRDQTWHRLPDLAEEYPWARAFGRYLAIPEKHFKAEGLRESAGKAEWRSKRSDDGPNVAETLKSSELAYPGRLHLYDIETEKTYTITTNQGDSEILLVDAGTVYYRASDRLYSATISEQGIGAAKLIAQDELIRDAHWAFLKH